jgi:hypothetical protein
MNTFAIVVAHVRTRRDMRVRRTNVANAPRRRNVGQRVATGNQWFLPAETFCGIHPREQRRFDTQFVLSGKLSGFGA